MFADQFNVWTQAAISWHVSERWTLLADGSVRRNDGFSRPMQEHIRIGMERDLGAWSSAVGYAYFLTQPYGAFPSLTEYPEHRIWEQVVFKHRTGRIRWSHRLRAEQRFIERYSKVENRIVPNGFPLLYRFRLQTVASIPLSNREDAPGAFTLMPFGEVMLRSTDASVMGPLDQVRAGVWCGWKCSTRAQARIGYMFHYLVRSDDAHVERNQTLLLSLLFELPAKATAKKGGT